tara:strand:+ start:1596 stop:1790 length:195 start_codon:yes stop_codon:yes gene_type:complete
MKYKCKQCGATMNLQKSTTVRIDDKWVTKEAECCCESGVYMEEVLTKEHKGFPTIKRNDSAQKI